MNADKRGQIGSAFIRVHPRPNLLARLRPPQIPSISQARPHLDRPSHLFQGCLMRCRRLLTLAVCLVACWFSAERAEPQQPGQAAQAPRLYQVLPSGGQLGTSFEVVVSGQDLEQATGLLFSEPGITA